MSDRAATTLGYPQSHLYFVYRGKERLKQDGVLCIPGDEFLANLNPDKFPD